MSIRPFRLPHESNEFVQPPDPRVALADSFRVLWRWRLSFVLSFTLVCALGFVFFTLMPRQFTARAVMIVGFSRQSQFGGDLPQYSHRPDPDIDGAIERATLPQAMIEVSRILKLGDQLPQVSPHSDQAVAEYLKRVVKAERIGHSNLIAIQFAANSPTLAAEVVNSIIHLAASGGNTLIQMTLAEQASFDLPRLAVLSPAETPLEPSFPNNALFAIATLFAAMCCSFSTVLLRHYFARKVS
jgi:uncharacterized protein involved in exopolysaccharide biosynthesis